MSFDPAAALAGYDPDDPSTAPTGGYVGVLGMVLTEAGPDASAVRWDGPVGTVAAYTAAVETVCSTGAALWWGGRGRCVGMSNHTTVLEFDAVGPFLARATPVHRGEVQQLWRAEITAGDGTRCASGEVLMANLTP